jgi:choline dehydrogenase-like flavoprotein
MTTTAAHDDDMDRRVRANQKRLAAGLERPYDFIVCGAGSSGSVVARRLAEDGTASVLVLEAGGSDDVASITEAALWHTNIGGERDWGAKSVIRLAFARPRNVKSCRAISGATIFSGTCAMPQ